MFSLIGQYLYAFIIYPIEMFIETVFSISMEMVPNAGYAIIFVSIAVQLLVLPMYKKADEIQENERKKQTGLSKWISHIKKTFKGDEQLMILSEYYRQNDYQPWYTLKGMLPLFLQIPFFIAAYHFLSNCSTLNGASFYILKDMGRPDALINIGGISINVMPIAMTLINIASGIIYTKGLPLKDKLQLYATAGVFLVLLYPSPSGLVFYWTLNNLFSLFKNIFMKIIKHPKQIAAAAAALFVLAYDFKCIRAGMFSTSSGRIVIILMLILGFIPAVSLIFDKIAKKDSLPVTKEATRIFRVSTVVMAVTTGIMIPVITMSSSPTEFVIRGHYVNPLVQVIYCFVTASGVFILWGNIIYSFYSKRARQILSCLLPAISVCALINSQFFRDGLGNMSMNMVYYDTFSYTTKECLINLAILLAAGLIFILMYKFKKKFLLFISFDLLIVCLILSAINIIKIQSSLNSQPVIKDDEYYLNNDVHFTLDRKGKNVVVMFLDRAYGPFLPYILNEKPELKKAFQGFTYYKNTVSFGTHTASGAPGLLGGYDYSAYELHKNKDAIGSYQSSSVKVMPGIFAENGFKTTVLDMPYFIDTGGKTIQEFYNEVNPEIEAWYADGVVKTEAEAIRDFNYFALGAKANFIRHSIFLSAPLLFRTWLFDDGFYLMQTGFDDRNDYAGHIEELDRLNSLTSITSTGENTYTYIENDTPHVANVNLQMPDYTLEETVDNSPFLTEWHDQLSRTPGSTGINMYTDAQIQSYEVNMAALLSVGRWLDFLKENGLYDNTRIIIAADHGYLLYAFDDMVIDPGDNGMFDTGVFAPLLMVKDFADSKAEDTVITSDEFMTNADVPTIAMEGLIDDPVNPYTGNPINSDRKLKGEQYLFEDGRWLSVHDDIYDSNNWKIVPDPFAGN